MKREEYKEAYIALTNLYGIVSSNVVFEILKKYEPNLTKEEVYADLKSMSEKSTNFYWVRPIEGINEFIIQKERLDDKTIDEIIIASKDKPIYVPYSFDKLLFYYDENKIENKFDDGFDFAEALEFFLDNVRTTHPLYDSLSLVIIPKAFKEDLKSFKSYLETHLEFNSYMDKNEFTLMCSKLVNHRKKWELRGFSEYELYKMYGYDIDDIEESLSNSFSDIDEINDKIENKYKA